MMYRVDVAPVFTSSRSERGTTHLRPSRRRTTAGRGLDSPASLSRVNVGMMPSGPPEWSMEP